MRTARVFLALLAGTAAWVALSGMDAMAQGDMQRKQQMLQDNMRVTSKHMDGMMDTMSHMMGSTHQGGMGTEG